MALTYVELLDKDGNTYRVLTDTIDEEGNSHAQVFKPAFGADTDVSVVDTDTPLPVGLYGDDGSQWVFSAAIDTTVTPTLSTSAYASGDCLFVATAVPSAAATSGGTGHLLRLTAIDIDDQGIEMDIYIYASSVTGLTANSAYSGNVSDGDGATFIEKLTLGDTDHPWEDHGGFQTCTLGVGDGLPVPYYCSGGTSLYLVGVTRGTPTHTASGLKLRVHCQPN